MIFKFSEIKISKTAVKALLSDHPWIYRNKVLTEPTDNPWVYIKDKNIYYGIFEPLGAVAVRIISKDIQPTIENMSDKLLKLFDTRKSFSLQNYNSNSFRLVHGEMDKFPGLTIDVFNNLMVVQPYLKTWEPLLPVILEKLIKAKNISCYVKVPKQRGSGKTGYFIGQEINEDYVIFEESAYRFASFFKSGQKTGYYLDLRELRKYISEIDLQGKQVLDLCASDGALTCIMKKKGAVVTSVEISAASLERSKINHQLNNLDFNDCDWETKDAWNKIKETSDKKYDLIIIDPPNLATSQNQVPNAIRAWKQLNSFAINKIKAGGTIISCNCSSRLTQDIHKKSIGEVIEKHKIKIKNFFFLKNTFDHPVSKKIPELNYLDISILTVL